MNLSEIKIMKPFDGELRVVKDFGEFENLPAKKRNDINKINYGVVYSAKRGTPVIAGVNGVVLHIHSNYQKYGQCVWILSWEEKVSAFSVMYGCLGEIKVQLGQRVFEGDTVLGAVGDLGRHGKLYVKASTYADNKPIKLSVLER